MSDAALAADERRIHDRLAAMSMSLPQVLDVLVSGSDGSVLASARRYPVERASIADRELFWVLQGGGAEPYISTQLTGRLEDAKILVVARRRPGPDGAFGGVVGVAVNPAYFETRYIATGLADADGATTVVLARSDGVALARAPRPPSAMPTLTPSFFAAVRSGAEWSSYTATSLIDGARRDVLVHRIGDFPLYIITTVSRGAIFRSFLHTLMPHFIFGAPATVALVCLVLLALRRTRQAEADRLARAEAERGVAQAAKLESVGRLAAGIAHDFNNLLAAIIGSMETMQRRIRAGRMDELDNLVTRGLQAARRGADLTRRMTLFARPSEAPPSVLDPGRVAHQVAELLPSLLGPRIAIAVDAPAECWPVVAVPALLEAALMNLAANARDAMPEGGALTIAIANIAAGGGGIPASLDRGHGWVRIAVSDTGHGFPETIRARAFEPFLTTKEVGKGGGLGLAQVYAFATRIGGTARIEEPAGGRGATVAMYLPRSNAAVAEEPPVAAAAPVRTGRRVLLVDDDSDVRGFSAMALRDAGYVVVEAPSAAAGLEQLAQGQFDVLIVDHTMPGATGAEMIAAARARHAGLPAIMISGQSDILAFDLPTDVYRVAKPFTMENLSRHIEMVCGGAVAAKG
jgi:two-component system NtrC family sensor kinase